MHVSEKITNILNYYSGNPNCDPNIYEFVEVCHDMGVYLSKEAPNCGIHERTIREINDKGDMIEISISAEECREQYPIPCAIYDKFQILSAKVKEKLLGDNLDINKTSPLYRLYEDVSLRAVTYSIYKEYTETEFYKKIGAVSLFISQEKRENPEFRYTNEGEMAYIQELAKQCTKLLMHDTFSQDLLNEIEASMYFKPKSM